MKKEEFLNLSNEEKEEFINSGGVIDNEIILDSSSSKVATQEITGINTTSDTYNIETESVNQILPTNNHNAQPDPALPSSSERDGTPPPDVPYSTTSNIDGFDIRDPLELLLLLDDNIASGNVKLYPWQIQFMTDFAKGGASDKFPFQSVVRACNGSGKDKYIIAPCVVWLSMRYKNTVSPVTSSSGFQLDNQTCRYITNLCEAVNRKFGMKIWETKYRQYTCNFDNGVTSKIFCYATDEAGKAEGFHPTDFGCKMGIFVSEDKTVTDEINIALNKCTGYTHRVHVSTPGLPSGHFFDYCQTAVNRKDIKDILDVDPIDWIQYHVTAFDCEGHISANYVKQMKRDLIGGEHGSAYKSQVLAEFGSGDEQVVIPYTYIWQANHQKEEVWVREEFNKAGLDLSDGGDETVLVVRNGNKVLKVIPFKMDNTQDTIAYLSELFDEWNLKSLESKIFADCGGIGKPMLDQLKRMGWNNIHYIDNRHASKYPKTFKGLFSEMWFSFRKYCENREIILSGDDLSNRQLSTRQYKIIADGRHWLIPKAEAKAKGQTSPDRADAHILAFADYKMIWKEPVLDEEKRPFKLPEVKKSKPVFQQRVWAKEKDKHNGYPRVSVSRDDSHVRYLLGEINKNVEKN